MRIRSDDEIMRERECTMRAVEKLAYDLETRGQKRAWCASLIQTPEHNRCTCACVIANRYDAVKDPELRHLAAEVNGPLMQLLAKKVNYHDGASVNLFREGAPLVGKLHRTGNGEPHNTISEISAHELKANRCDSFPHERVYVCVTDSHCLQVEEQRQDTT